MAWIDPPGGRPWGLYAVCAASLSMNAWFVLTSSDVPSDAPAFEQSTAALVATTPPPTAAAEPTAEPLAASPAAALSATGAPPPPGTEVHRLDVVSSLSHTFVDNLPENRGAVVSQVFARLFFWNVDLRRDLLRGDEIRVAYSWDGQLAHIPVASYHSKKLDKTFAAYEFVATGDTYPSWWDDQGDEVALRLTETPLAQYQQITSLLKDRPTHRGMDFKVPEGTPVLSPKSGRVERIDWNVKFNGNCVEVRNDDGVISRYLHLSRVDVKAGDTLAPGQPVGLSGNTGRSTAPHLHYELERNGEVVDPVDYHGVQRRKLTGEDLARFEAEKSRMGGWLAWAK